MRGFPEMDFKGNGLKRWVIAVVCMNICMCVREWTYTENQREDGKPTGRKKCNNLGRQAWKPVSYICSDLCWWKQSDRTAPKKPTIYLARSTPTRLQRWFNANLSSILHSALGSYCWLLCTTVACCDSLLLCISPS